MGLDPILMLEQPQLYDNYKVNIIRPGEDLEEESRELTVNTENKLINTNKTNKKNSKNTDKEEKEKNNLDLTLETNELIATDDFSLDEKDESISSETIEVEEDPRRKRRRSSASS